MTTETRTPGGKSRQTRNYTSEHLKIMVGEHQAHGGG